MRTGYILYGDYALVNDTFSVAIRCDPLMSKIAENIAALMKRDGLPQHQVAQALGVRQATVSEWKTGKREPEPANVTALAELFRTSEDELRFGEPAARKAPWADPSAPANTNEAGRRVRAIASRLEGDLYEWGAEDAHLSITRAALATDETVRMLQSAPLTERELADVFANYMRFVEAFRLALHDRIAITREALSAPPASPARSVVKVPAPTPAVPRPGRASRKKAAE